MSSVALGADLIDSTALIALIHTDMDMVLVDTIRFSTVGAIVFLIRTSVIARLLFIHDLLDMVDFMAIAIMPIIIMDLPMTIISPHTPTTAEALTMVPDAEGL